MSNMAPDLSGLDPFINAFIVVGVIGALISLVIIGGAVLSSVGLGTSSDRPRARARRYPALSVTPAARRS
jgi:hypothetical protein